MERGNSMSREMSEIITAVADFDITDKAFWKQLGGKVSQIKTFLIGLVIVIGSVGLLLGACTCAVASAAMVYFGVELVPAMLIGFFSIGIISLIAGAVIMMIGIPK